jgi:hypothetical protein
LEAANEHTSPLGRNAESLQKTTLTDVIHRVKKKLTRLLGGELKVLSVSVTCFIH